MKYKIALNCIHCKAPISIEVIKNNFADHRCLACGIIFHSESNDNTALIYSDDKELLKVIDQKSACCSG